MTALLFQQVGPKATPGVAQPDNPPSSTGGGGGQQQQAGGSMWIMMAPVLMMMVVMLFMNSRQRKKESDIRAKLKKGDKVVSQSGIIGELVEIDERVAKVQIAPGTKVQMLVSTISPYEPAASKADDKQLKDLKDAKATADKK